VPHLLFSIAKTCGGPSVFPVSSEGPSAGPPLSKIPGSAYEMPMLYVRSYYVRLEKVHCIEIVVIKQQNNVYPKAVSNNGNSSIQLSHGHLGDSYCPKVSGMTKLELLSEAGRPRATVPLVIPDNEGQ
jgi:hypothetical protein